MADAETQTALVEPLAATDSGQRGEESDGYSLGAGVIDNSWSGSDRYQIQRELGRGGMAVVYLAEEVGTGQLVALKVMQSKLSGTAKQRFTREFSTIASLKHENLIEVYEYGETPEGPFFAMEYFPGQTAREMIGAPLKQILAAVYNLCEAIDFVHSKRIIHRDIKPGNVLASRRPDGSGFDVKLSDFGLAKFANTSSTLSRDTNFLGTVAYCAPEQILRDELDHRADLYSLGLMVHELLTGHHPFEEQRNDVQALVNSQITVVPKSLRRFRDDVSTELASCVDQLLAKNPVDRPSSTKDLRRVLARDLGWSTEALPDGVLAQVNNLLNQFVGRTHEIERVETIVGQALSQRRSASPSETDITHALFITGEAGMGKTTLMKRSMRKALVTGAKIYDGRCFEGNIAPFQPFCEIIRQILSELDHVKDRMRHLNSDTDPLASTCVLQSGHSSTEIESIVESYATELLRVGPELRNLLAKQLPTTTAEAQRDPKYIFRAIASFFVELSRVQPICLLIEDIHWADKSSLDLFRHILGEIEAVTHQLTGQERSPALMICLTSRSGNVYKNTLEFIETVCQSPVACRLQLTKMPRDESTALIASVLDTREELIDEEIIAYVSENCFGNPFYIAQSAREWRDTSWFVNESGRWKLSSKESDRPQASSGMRDAIGQRLGRLSDSARQLASMGSVIGAIVDIDLLETICDSIDEFTFYNGLDELLASGVLREGLQTRHLNFTHDLFREAANAMLSQPRSERTHLKIAAELKERLDEGQEISSARLAEHFVSGGRPRQAWPYFLDAARRANNSQAFPDSVQILETANKAVPADADQRDQFEFKMLYGRALFEIGRVDAGRTQLDLAAKTAETGIQLANARWAIANSYPPMDNGDLVAKHLYEALRAIGEKPRISVLSRLSSIWISTMLMNLPKSLLRWFGGNNSRYALASKIYMDLSLASVGHDLLGYIQATSRNPVVATFSNDVDCITSAYSKYAINYAISGAIPSRFGRRFRRVARSKVKDCRSPFARAYALTHLGTSEYVDGNLHDAECLIREAIPFF